MKTETLQDMSQMEERYRKHLREKAKHFRRTDSALCLRIWPDREDSSEYEIAFSRMQTEAEALDWAMHLTEKTWFTITHLRIFLATAAEIRKRAGGQ